MQLKTLFESVKATVLDSYLSSEKVDLNAHKLAEQGAVSDSCPDNFILETRFDGEHWHIPTEFSRTEVFTRQDLPEGRCLFIILESPHVSEFEGEKPMPAAGTTGDNVLLAFTTPKLQFSEWVAMSLQGMGISAAQSMWAVLLFDISFKHI